MKFNNTNLLDINLIFFLFDSVIPEPCTFLYIVFFILSRKEQIYMNYN